MGSTPFVIYADRDVQLRLVLPQNGFDIFETISDLFDKTKNAQYLKPAELKKVQK